MEDETIDHGHPPDGLTRNANATAEGCKAEAPWTGMARL